MVKSLVTYLAICQGQLSARQKIKGYIRHDETTKKIIFILQPYLANKTKTCNTVFTPLFTHNNYTLIECQLITGRKHQIHSTLDFLNLPIIGDTKYGSLIKTPEKIVLFAYYLTFHDLKAPLSYLNNKEFVLENLKTNLINQIKTEKW